MVCPARSLIISGMEVNCRDASAIAVKRSSNPGLVVAAVLISRYSMRLSRDHARSHRAISVSSARDISREKNMTPWPFSAVRSSQLRPVVVLPMPGLPAMT